MGRPKGSKNKTGVEKDPNVEETYETIVEFNCPVRGLVKQKVKVKKLKKQTTDSRAQVTGGDDTLSHLEKEDDGLFPPIDEETE